MEDKCRHGGVGAQEFGENPEFVNPGMRVFLASDNPVLATRASTQVCFNQPRVSPGPKRSRSLSWVSVEGNMMNFHFPSSLQTLPVHEP